MPLYDHWCPRCEAEWEALVRVADTAFCQHCGMPGERLISRPVVRPDLEPYDDDGLGVRVLSRAHRRQIMRSKDLVEYDATVRPHGARGTVFSFPGRTTTSVPPSGAFSQSARAALKQTIRELS